MLDALVTAEDWEGLAEYVSRRYDVTVSAEALEHECRWRLDGLRRLTGGLKAYDHGLMAWMKQRLITLGAFPAGGLGQPEVRLEVPLHIGFLGIEETAEHLARLRGGRPHDSSVARSKIFTGEAIPSPIDLTAIRVAPPDGVSPP